jgi:hypothetical protein
MVEGLIRSLASTRSALALCFLALARCKTAGS